MFMSWDFYGSDLDLTQATECYNVVARGQNKRALGPSYNMAVGLQEVMV